MKGYVFWVLYSYYQVSKSVSLALLIAYGFTDFIKGGSLYLSLL